MTAGGSLLRPALLSIRMLRRAATTLPIELWMADTDEFDEGFYEEVSKLNVRCRLLSDYVGVGVVRRFQLKSFAILFSAFADVLYLDADDFPVHSIDDIFTRSNYSSTGVVLWPDYWAATVSPWLPLIVNRPQRFWRTCETGQLMWNKQTHFTSLVLACYYNFHGPDYFYPLLTLGAAGQGDKETFLLACEVLDHPYTFIERDIGTLGYHDEGSYLGVAMIQADPRDTSRQLFIHAHFPKMDAESMFAAGPLQNSNGKRIDQYWGTELMQNVGYDVEVAAFQELAYIECESSLANVLDKTICDRVLDHLKGFA